MIRIIWTTAAMSRLKEAYNFLLRYDKEVAETSAARAEELMKSI